MITQQILHPAGVEPSELDKLEKEISEAMRRVYELIAKRDELLKQSVPRPLRQGEEF